MTNASTRRILGLGLVGKRCWSIASPTWLADELTKWAEGPNVGDSRATPARVSRCSMRSATRGLRDNANRARDVLGWKKGVVVEDALRSVVDPTAILERTM